jgi:hypothetical protein
VAERLKCIARTCVWRFSAGTVNSPDSFYRAVKAYMYLQCRRNNLPTHLGCCVVVANLNCVLPQNVDHAGLGKAVHR